MTLGTRVPTWATTGMDVSELSNVAKVLQKSKLDYVVEKTTIHLPNGNTIQDKFATVNTSNGSVMGIVGNQYNICQNEDAFDFVNYINEDLEFVKAGQTGGGIVYIIAKLPKTTVLDDEMTPYVIFQNGHNGQIPIRAAITPLRMICQNQFNMSFAKTANTINIRHASTMDLRMKTAQDVLKKTTDYMKSFKVGADELFSIKIANKEEEIIESYYQIEENKTMIYAERQERKRLNLMKAYRDCDDNQNFRGTAWGMINAYSDILTHQLPARDTDNWQESRFTKVTFDPKIMGKFIKHVKSFA
jgi:phage/plasmid-like protein (TIGR03299 family)